MRFRTVDILIFALLFVFVSAFPVNLFQIDEIYQLIIQIGLKLGLLGYYIYIIVINKINIFKFYNWKRLLLFIPFFLACFSNLIASSIDGAFMGYAMMNNAVLSLSIIFHFLTAIVEEILFRLFIHSSLIRVGSFKRILASAGIFALAHLLYVVDVRTVEQLFQVLVRVVYTFGLGVMLGFMFEYSYCLVGCIVLHFSFNLFNDVLFRYFGCNLLVSSLTYYLTAVVIAVVLAIYTLLIYLFVLSSNESYFRE